MKNIEFIKPEAQLEIIKQGSIEIISEEILLKKLKKSFESKTPLRVKCGIDPTGKDVHIGHAIPFMNMRRFQELGHTGVVIIGDYTATIGDPTGKDMTRPPRSLDDVQKDGKGFLKQLMHILIPEKTEVRFQSEWFVDFDLHKILNLAGKISVQHLLSHDTFKKRIESGSSLRLHELFYPLLQGFDSVAIKSDVELGDPSQKFNILIGRDLQKDMNIPQQVAVFNPVLIGTCGVEKMSKSLNNYIAINDSAFEKFGKIMSIPDSLVGHYFMYAGRATELELEEYSDKVKEDKLHPLEYKKIVATRILSYYHSDEETLEARKKFESIFTKKEIPNDLEIIKYSKHELLVDVLINNNVLKSKSEFKRLVQPGAVKINSNKVDDIEFKLTKDEYVLKLGKKRFYKLVNP